MKANIGNLISQLHSWMLFFSGSLSVLRQRSKQFAPGAIDTMGNQVREIGDGSQFKACRASLDKGEGPLIDYNCRHPRPQHKVIFIVDNFHEN